MINWKILKKFLSVALVLAMVACMVACDSDEIAEHSTAPTVISSTTTVPLGEAEGTDLVYTLTQQDVDSFYAALEQCEALSLLGSDLDAIDGAVEELETYLDFFDAQNSIATILHYSHTKDTALEKQYLDCVEIYTKASDAYKQMIKRVYLSDSPAKDHLFEGWTEEDIARLLAYNELVAQLQQRNAQIGVEYRSSEDDEYKIQLYIEFVGNNNTIAQIYGYDNYYTYAYRDVYGRDYDAASVEQMRKYAQQYLMECNYMAMENLYVSMFQLTTVGQLAVENFLYQDYNTLSKNYVELYIDALPQDMADALRTMLSKDSLFTNASDAMEGAFTTTIADRSYCFFGPGYASSKTVLHEGGHYFASRYTDLYAVPLDLAEVQSQGNEWLFIRFVKDHMALNRYNAVVDYLLYEATATILISLMVDEFEQIVYSSDLTGFTAKDFDAIMDQVSLRYYPEGDVSYMLTDMQYYWRAVVVEQPVYYISYAVSATAAIGLYTVSIADFDGALQIYHKLCTTPNLELGFLGNLQQAGLGSPFEVGFYQDLVQLLLGRSR